MEEEEKPASRGRRRSSSLQPRQARRAASSAGEKVGSRRRFDSSSGLDPAGAAWAEERFPRAGNGGGDGGWIRTAVASCSGPPAPEGRDAVGGARVRGRPRVPS